MLVGNTLLEFVFIRTVILGLRCITPISVAYTITIVLETLLRPGPGTFRLRPGLETYLFAETAFYLGVYLPQRFRLQRPATHPKALTKAERQVLFHRIFDNVSQYDRYLSGWFLGVPLEDIRKDSLKEFMAWSLLYVHLDQVSPEEDIELDGYVKQVEARLGQELRTSKGTTRSLRTTLDDVPMQHRPLMWYLVGML